MFLTFFGAKKEAKKEFLQGFPCMTSINPNPFFIRMGFRPLSKPLANLWQEA